MVFHLGDKLKLYPEVKGEGGLSNLELTVRVTAKGTADNEPFINVKDVHSGKLYTIFPEKFEGRIEEIFEKLTIVPCRDKSCVFNSQNDKCLHKDPKIIGQIQYGHPWAECLSKQNKVETEDYKPTELPQNTAPKCPHCGAPIFLEAEVVEGSPLKVKTKAVYTCNCTDRYFKAMAKQTISEKELMELRERRESAAELAGTNSCIDDERKANLFLKHRARAKELQDKYCGIYLSEREETSKKPYCCKISCNKPAEYEIWDGNRPDDYIHSCLEHIPDLISDKDVHYLYRIKEEVTK